MTTATFETGWTRGLAMPDYLAIRAMSASRLEDFRRSPQHYRHALDAPRETTTALERGTALHLALLEPEEFARQYVRSGQCGATKASGDRCSNPGVWMHRTLEWVCGVHVRGREEDLDRTPTVLTQDEHARVVGMRDAVLAHPRAQTLLDGEGELEVTGIFEDPETGAVCKIRPDRLVRRAALHVNVKSTRDASPWAFGADAARRGYHRKEAFYRRGLAALGSPCMASVIVAVESDPPHGVACYLFDEDHLRAADAEITRLLEHFKHCEAEDRWPGYGDEFLTLRLPGWATNAQEEE